MSAAERPADFDRLPARFKRYITAMESQLHAYQAAQLQQKPSRVSVRPLRLDTGQQQSATYLSETEPVRYRLGKEKDYSLEVRLARDGQRLEIRSSIGQVRVYSRSGNEIQVDESDRW